MTEIDDTTLPTHGRFQNLSGMLFGRLLVQGYIGRKGRTLLYQCLCVCKNTHITSADSLRSHKTQSCGCLKKERSGRPPKYLNNNHRRMKKTWNNIIARTEDPTSSSYERYGLRGIRMCKSWRDSFDTFFQDMGERPSDKHTIDRIDNNQDYSPDNCRWATPYEQGQNRRNSVHITFQGETHTISEWAMRYRIKRSILASRLYTGWNFEDAVTCPVREFKLKDVVT